MRAIFAGVCAAAVLLVGASARADDKSVEVMHYFTSGGELAAIKELEAAFTKAGGKWIDTPIAGGAGAAHDQALKTRVLAGNPPGAAMVKLRDAQTWYKDGYLVNLDDVAKSERWEEIYPPAIKAAAKTDGKWSAVPIDLLRADVMWVNPNVLAKVGATPPKTWDEFNAVADKLKAAGITPLAHGGQAWQDAVLFEFVALGVGGPDFYNKVFVDGDMDAMKSPTMKAVFDQYRKLRGDVDKDFSGRDWNLATGMLIKGDAAFQIMGDWVKGEVTAANLVPGKDILCVPTPRSGPPSFNWISNSLSFFSKHKGDQTATDGQKLLAAVLSHADAETAYALKKGGGVARLGVDPAPFDACGKWEIQTSAAANESGVLLPDFIGGMTPMAGVRGAVFDAVSDFFNSSDMSSEEGMKRLVNAVELAK